MTDDATLELLLDLKHDLGKYLLLPLALLPKDADDSAVRAALRRALLQTRTRRAGGPNGTDGSRHLSAAEIWRDAAAELERAGCARDALAPIEPAVEHALWGPRALDDEAALERMAIERDLGAVQAAIAALIDAARRG